MTRLNRLAVFFRFVDDDGNFSLTHLALYVGIVCMVLGRQVSWSEFSVFAVALASYRVKRALEGDPKVDSESFAKVGQAVTTLQDAVRKLQAPDRARNAQIGLGK